MYHVLMHDKLKLLSPIFYPILFHLKSPLRSRDIQIFVFRLPLFFPLSAIALEVDPRKILKFMTSSTV